MGGAASASATATVAAAAGGALGGLVEGVACPLLAQLFELWTARRGLAGAAAMVHSGGAADRVLLPRAGAVLARLAALGASPAISALSQRLDDAVAVRTVSVLQLWAALRCSTHPLLQGFSRLPPRDMALSANGLPVRLAREVEAAGEHDGAAALDVLLQMLLQCITEVRAACLF